MFEDRFISIWTYNLETLLGEKIETIIARETANTRMRDFYDIYVLSEKPEINAQVSGSKNLFLPISLISLFPGDHCDPREAGLSSFEVILLKIVRIHLWIRKG